MRSAGTGEAGSSVSEDKRRTIVYKDSLCVKGCYSYRFIKHPECLKTQLFKKR